MDRIYIRISLSIHILYILLNVLLVHSQNVVFKEHVTTTKGMSFPDEMNATLDSEITMRLTRFIANQEECNIRAPDGSVYDLLAGSLPNRLEKLNDGCGIRVKNISEVDDGNWKLSSVYQDDVISGYTAIHVITSVGLREHEETQVLIEGDNYSKVDLFNSPTDYCAVKKPTDLDVTIVQGTCQVDILQATKTIQGEWVIHAGVPGNVEEIPLIRNVKVQSGQLDTGFVYDEDSKKLHIYCNLINMDNNVTFCRFQRQSDDKGFHLSDGLSNGQYSYYGNGLSYRECGITVEKATNADLISWRCFLGLSRYDNATTDINYSIVESIVRVNANEVSNFFASKANESEQGVTSTRQEALALRCNVDASLSYCWFKHPNGTQLTQINNSSDAPYQIVTDGLNGGRCGIIFKNADYNDTGRWECHMGTTSVGLEAVQVINVRITGPLAAETNEIDGHLGKEVNITCVTAAGPKNLKYCRFIKPNGIGFNIDDTIIKERAIMDKYYFKEGAKMYQGECSITISSIEEDDIGEWKCAAEIEGMKEEFEDSIRIIQDTATSNQSTSIASTIGISVGVVFAVAIVAAGGVVAWRKRRKERTPTLQIGEERVHDVSNIEMEDVELPRISTGSSSSSELFNPASRRPQEFISIEAGTGTSPL